MVQCNYAFSTSTLQPIGFGDNVCRLLLFSSRHSDLDQLEPVGRDVSMARQYAYAN